MPAGGASPKSGTAGGEGSGRGAGGERDSRRRILDAAAAQFGRNGFGGARTQAIADEAGVNKAMLYYHFQDKEALYAAALEDQFKAAVRRILPRFLEEGPGAAERLLGVIRGYGAFFASHPHMRNMMLREIADGGERFREVFEAVKEDVPGFGPDLLRERIEALMARGDLRRQDPEQVLLHLISLAIFPHLARPILRVLWDFDDEALEGLMEERPGAILELFRHGLLNGEEGA
ncbi:MAG: TetR/AcrR family transcriptional regulator [bacterium]